MTISIAIVLGLLFIAIVIFASEKVSVDIVTLGVLIVLVLCRILTPAEAFEGFSSDIIIILGSIFVISAALQETGVLEVIGARLLQLAGTSANRLLLLLMSVVAGISGFMNNTTVTAMFLPPTIGLAKKAKISPSKLLIPLAYASILGGTCTLIGTSTNVAVSGFVQKAGMQPLGLFEMTPLGLIIVAVGVAYMMLIGQRLLVDRTGESATAGQAIREYLSEIIVLPDSPLIGQRVHDSDLTILDFTILKVIRGRQELPPAARLEIQEGDTVLVEGNIENLIKVKGIEGIAIKPEMEQGDLQTQNQDFRIAEVLITPRSDLLNLTLTESHFRTRFGLTVLAIFRQGQTLQKTIRNVRLEVGDLLLVQGAEERVDTLRHDPGLSIIEQRAVPVYQKMKGLYTIGFFGVALVLSGIGWVAPSIAFLAAALASILMRCISIERAYEFIDWRLLILIGGMTAFGTAMENTGAAEYLAKGIVGALEPFGILSIMAGFFLLTILLTQPMSNAAAALVVLPIAISTAKQLDANPRTFAIAVMLAASISFIAPFEPSCILVYGPGKYRFMDFVKTGIGLTAILSVVVLLLIPVFWPLR